MEVWNREGGESRGGGGVVGGLRESEGCWWNGGWGDEGPAEGAGEKKGENKVGDREHASKYVARRLHIRTKQSWPFVVFPMFLRSCSEFSLFGIRI